ncbi:ADP-ribosylglycohydrolase family protein [Uruburuella testudinis]|uniref:ADP-ribosylglycohydrolase family protein n=1 Tax=Uruburuella testudinis TaxID=1282863 RepID=A0ABY4DVF8_9NEIS|nr:ADP-ribosylglycohydrolase family protein [Uruburuella testudinis]UOO82650.1 ADP-ribosylglycohydrolase family protein [Uruburuella testudinis]
MAAYNSFGNGAAIRTSPLSRAAESLQQALDLAEASAAITHNHPEGIKGAQAVAAAVFWAREGRSKDFIRQQIAQRFGYSFARSCDDIREVYEFNETCQETVPEALTAFFESRDFEHALRLAVSLGGDSDTLAAVTCSVAEAYYGVPDDIAERTHAFLPDDIAATLAAFTARCCRQTPAQTSTISSTI